MKIPICLTSKCIIIMLGAAVIISTVSGTVESQVVEALAEATKKAEGNKYFGVVKEVDKGEGVFALEWDTFGHSASEWAGMIAEFKRRHPDLEISSHSNIDKDYISRISGVMIITAPKNRCPQ